ncbi:MAG: TSCPD domain-containing protein [Planctomycetota bacterium]|jgi:ribonucleoside-diphosphate reductase alpha chain
MAEQVLRFEPERYHLDNERSGTTWKLMIGDLMGVQLGTENRPPPGRGYFVKAYINTGEYPDGDLGEVFISLDKEGSFARGVLDGFSLLLSIALQHGIPLESIAEKYLYMRFEPSGYTNDNAVPMASSFFDLVFRKLVLRYLDDEALERLGVEDYRKKLEKACVCQEEEDGEIEDKFTSQRPSTGLSGEPFNRSASFEEGRDAKSSSRSGESAGAPGEECRGTGEAPGENGEVSSRLSS